MVFLFLIHSMKKTIDELKKEYIGQTFNWLTILDVYRNENKYLALCKCKCGNIKETNIYKLISGHTKSCGCYPKSKEFSDKQKQYSDEHPENIANSIIKYHNWRTNNPDKVTAANEKHKQWFKDNPDKVEEQRKQFKQWCESNPDKVKSKTDKYLIWYNNNPEFIADKNKRHSQWHKDNKVHFSNICKIRAKKFYDKVLLNLIKGRQTNFNISIKRRNKLKPLLKIVHPDYIRGILDGSIHTNDLIKTKCPNCGNYSLHTLRNVFKLKSTTFKHYNPPLCSECTQALSSSSYEYDISEYIKQFYNSKFIKNDRSILHGKELDLYYPEKKIAIEFNGDYWHSSEHKDKDYHVNKYLRCKEQNIILVSIFESEWNKNKESIKAYLKDLFNNKENTLSFNEDHTLMNNNYPSPKIKLGSSLIKEDYYVYNKYKVYTCGYSKIY